MASAARKIQEAVEEEKKIAVSEALKSVSFNRVEEIYSKAHEVNNFCDMVVRLEADIVRIEEALEDGMKKEDDVEFSALFVKAYDALYDDERKLQKTYELSLQNIEDIIKRAKELNDIVKGLKKKHERNAKEIPELYERYLVARQQITQEKFKGLGAGPSRRASIERARESLRNHRWI
ncbi:MAG: hypothetical protein ABIA62_07540 [Candidatus Woesearchaeota archaeon]